MPRNIRLALLILACSASLACVTPQRGGVSANSKPGWGRTHSPEQQRMTVRAVPAAAEPSAPLTRIGKPGWGRVSRAAR